MTRSPRNTGDVKRSLVLPHALDVHRDAGPFSDYFMMTLITNQSALFGRCTSVPVSVYVKPSDVFTNGAT